MRPPATQVSYKVGDKIEVCSKEEGFMGSYYEATIASCLENGKYEVLYKTILEDDESGPLKETLFLKDIRPIPPRVRKSRRFQLNQRVDVFYNDGWWLGIITSEKILIRNRYYIRVYFSTLGRIMYCPCTRIRVHQELIYGEWISSRFI
ncbi:hypothetical protein TSUD_205330 [Trifolium subterraneum]|uniref:Agenet domain-containing protein n=1 Tax=Trifolium subterraneum TaxID=3900 RepID=A0A2Z6N7F5_TRISU|nr:hypothetical protein TSUD_205330 [Trifolium subterraneum]